MRLFTRSGYDWAEYFPQIVAAALALGARSCLIDGEAVCCDDSGLAVFADLRRGRNRPLTFVYAFDLLQLDGEDLCAQPLEQRKRLLLQLVRKAPFGLAYNDHIEGSGEHVFKHACDLGCEGIVSKRRGSHYQSGRTHRWVKTKNPHAPAVRRLVEEDWRK